MGGAQPLAVTMNEGVAKAIEARDAKQPLSIGVVGNAAEIFPALLERDAPIDIVTDQTSAHDPLSYLPLGIDLEDMAKMADKDSGYVTERAQESMAKHVAAMVDFLEAAKLGRVLTNDPAMGVHPRRRP